MTELQWLFAILAALYAWECIGWLRRGSVAFTTWTGARWRIQHPTVAIGNHNGGFIFAAPLPPLGSVFIANQLPFSLSPKGVLFFVATNMNPGFRPAQSGRFLIWEEAQKIRLDGKKLLLGKEKIYTAATSTLASHLFTTLTTTAKHPANERESAIKQLLRDAMDVTRITEAKNDFQSRIKPMRWLTNILFVHVFIVAPVLASVIGLPATWLGLVLVMLTLTVSIGILFHRAHRKFYPDAKDERFTHTLTTALAAATSIRACDIASRSLLERFHPLAVAKVLLNEETFRAFARKLVIDLRYPMLPTCPNPLPAAISTEKLFRNASLEIAEAWLKENRIGIAELCHAPQPLDNSCRAYCPRCEAQFTSAEHRCSDCGGLALAIFSSAMEKI